MLLYKNNNILLVVCGVIFREDGRLAVTQRSEAMPLPLKWEFPGGKVAPEEAPSEALVRELKEELDITVLPREGLQAFDFVEQNRIIRLLPFVCLLPPSETVVLAEHAAIRWVNRGELDAFDWADADVPIAEYVQQHWDRLLPVKAR